MTAPRDVIQHLPGPGLGRSLPAWFQLGSLAKGHLEHVQGAAAPSVHPGRWEPAVETRRSARCPARCAQSLEHSWILPARVTAQLGCSGCSCRLTAELLFHASLVLLARN